MGLGSIQILTFPFDFAVTTALDTHLVGSSTFVKVHMP